MCYNVSKTDPYLSSFHSGSLWLWTSRYQIGPSHGWTAQESCKVIIFCKIGILKRGWVLILKAVKVYNCLLVYRWKFMYLKCVEWCEDMIDHRGYAHNLSSCEIKAWKKSQALTGLEPMTSAIPVQCSTNWANKPTESWPLCDNVTEYARRRWRMQARSVIAVYVLSLCKDGNILTRAKRG